MGILGVILGAWVYETMGWKGVWFCVAVSTPLFILDKLFGEKIGRSLAVWTMQFVQ